MSGFPSPTDGYAPHVGGDPVFDGAEDFSAIEDKIRREYKNSKPVTVEYDSKRGQTFIVERFLEIDERGGDIGTTPLVFQSADEKDKGAIIIASHALQTSRGLSIVLKALRFDFLDGSLSEAIDVVEAAKSSIGIECEKHIAELREYYESARGLLAADEDRKRLAAAGSSAPRALPAARAVSRTKPGKSEKKVGGKKKAKPSKKKR